MTPPCGARWRDDPADHCHQCARPDTGHVGDEDDPCRCDCGAEVVWGDPGDILDVAFMPRKAVQNSIRSAASGDIVWITENGQRIAAIVSRDIAEHLPVADRLIGAVRQIVREEIASQEGQRQLFHIKYG